MARVDAFTDSNSRIVSKLPVELARADIESVDARGSMLKEAIREAARGCADVKAHHAAGIDGPVRKRRLQLETAAADVLKLFRDLDLNVIGYHVPGLIRALSAHPHTAGK